MKLARITVACALLAFSCVANAAFSFQWQKNYDNTRTPQYPNGDKPTIPCTTPTGYTLASKGSGFGNWCEDDASTFTFDGGGSSTRDQYRYIYKDVASGNIQLVARIVDDYATATNAFAGIGIGISESTAQAAYAHQCVSPLNASSGVRSLVGLPDEMVTTSGDSSLERSFYAAIVYDESAGQTFCYYSTDGALWRIAGQDPHTYTTPIVYLFGQSGSSTEFLQATADNIAYQQTINVPGLTVPVIGVATATGDDVSVAYTAGTATGGVLNHEIWHEGPVSACDADTMSLLDTDTNGTPYVAADLANGLHCFKLRVTDIALNQSGFSDVASATVSVAAPAPNAPTFPALTVVSSSQINLSWSANGTPAPTSYKLEYSLTGTGSWTDLDCCVSVPLTTSLSHSGLAPSTQYFYRLSAFNGPTQSTFSTRNATTDAAPGINTFRTLDYESGSIKDVGQATDSVNFQTLPHPQTGTATFENGAVAGSNCCGPSATSPPTAPGVATFSLGGLDGMIVGSYRAPTGELVTPRLGNRFMHVRLNRSQDHRFLSGGATSTDKPRFKQIWPNLFPGATEVWWGGSYRFPNDFIDEQSQSGHGNGPTLLLVNGSNSNGVLSLKAQTKQPGDGTSANPGLCGNTACLTANSTHLWAVYPIKTTVGEPGEGDREWRDLGDIDDYLGEWADIVVRFKNNPFTSDGTRNGIFYKGNGGVLEVWISDPDDAPDPTGYRDMIKVVSECNEPVGLLYPSGELLDVNNDIYYYGWQDTNPTSRPAGFNYMVDFDEIAFGRTVTHGMDYDDVNPSHRTWEPGHAPCAINP